MTFGVDMAELATELVAEFSTEIGVSTLRQITGDTYDTTTGLLTPAHTDHETLIAFDEIQSEEATSESYLAEHQMAIIAGNDITVEPQEGWFIIKPGGASTHRIVSVITDQYSAAFFCHIQRKPE